MPKKQVKVKRAPTRKQLSRWQRERRVRRLTLYIGFSIIGLVLLLIMFGFYDKEIRTLRKPAIRVNDTVIRTEHYIELLKLFAQSDNPVMKANIADYTLSIMQNNELIKQAAVKMGIVVTPGEIEEAMKKAKLPLAAEKARDLVLVDLYGQKVRENISASSIPKRSDQAHLLMIVTKGEEQAEEIFERLQSGADFASVARQFSIDAASREKGGDLGWVPRELMESSVATLAFTILPGYVSHPRQQEGTNNYFLLKVLDRKNDMEISSENREKLVSVAFSRWVNSLRQEGKIEVYLNEKDKLKALELARNK